MRLEPEGIRAFHEHALRILHEQKRQTSAFLKSLLISKLFFNAARHYEIYQFGLECYPKVRMFFNPVNRSDDYLNRSLKISLMRLEKLAKFLNPKFVAVSLYFREDEKIEQFERLLEQIQGKISVDPGIIITKRILSFMQKFATRIHQLRCLGETFEMAEPIIPALTLELCDIWEVSDYGISSDSLRLLLLTKAKKIRVDSSLPFLKDAILANVDTTDRNRSVSNLSLKIHDCEYASVDVFTDWIFTRFPKLQKLNLQLLFEIPAVEVNSDDIVKHVLRYHKKLQEVQDIFSHLAHFNLGLNLNGRSPVPHDDSWRVKLGKYEEFKNSQAPIPYNGIVTSYKWSMESNINNCYGKLEVSIWSCMEDDQD